MLSAGRVTFMPAVEWSRYASILKGADLLVIPRPTSVASQAGFPYKLVEYIASGAPVLVTNFGDVEEYFAGGEHCLICRADDPAALADGIRFALEHPDQMRAIARQGQKRTRELFAFESVAGQLRNLIEEAGGAHG